MFPNNRVEQKDSLYFGFCKKGMSVTAGHPTYCDCTSYMQTCAPGLDVVSCASSTNTGKGWHLPGICCSLFCSYKTCYHPISCTYTFTGIILIHHPLASSDSNLITNCSLHLYHPLSSSSSTILVIIYSSHLPLSS